MVKTMRNAQEEALRQQAQALDEGDREIGHARRRQRLDINVSLRDAAWCGFGPQKYAERPKRSSLFASL
jgi:hypothetical protein